MKSLRILSGRDLADLAIEIRNRHAGFVCSCICDCDFDDTENSRKMPPKMDARERKWAAGKLLRPICPDQDDNADLTPADRMEVARQTWELLKGDMPFSKGYSPERVRRTARQLQHTTAFARQCWGMKVSTPPPAEPEDYDPSCISVLTS